MIHARRIRQFSRRELRLRKTPAQLSTSTETTRPSLLPSSSPTLQRPQPYLRRRARSSRAPYCTKHRAVWWCAASRAHSHARSHRWTVAHQGVAPLARTRSASRREPALFAPGLAWHPRRPPSHPPHRFLPLPATAACESSRNAPWSVGTVPPSVLEATLARLARSGPAQCRRPVVGLHNPAFVFVSPPRAPFFGPSPFPPPPTCCFQFRLRHEVCSSRSSTASPAVGIFFGCLTSPCRSLEAFRTRVRTRSRLRSLFARDQPSLWVRGPCCQFSFDRDVPGWLGKWAHDPRQYTPCPPRRAHSVAHGDAHTKHTQRQRLHECAGERSIREG